MLQIGGIQGAVLSLLGLLLGFTMAMAVSRYDMRRDLVVKEANATGLPDESRAMNRMAITL